jgi:hypothetical protein
VSLAGEAESVGDVGQGLVVVGQHLPRADNPLPQDMLVRGNARAPLEEGRKVVRTETRQRGKAAQAEILM